MKSILFFAPNWIGDAVMSTPLLRSIKKFYPSASVHIVAKKAVCELLDGLKYINDSFSLPSHPLQQLKLAYELRKYKYSSAFVLPHSFRSALLAFITGASLRIGYDCNSRGFLLSHRIAFPQDGSGNRKIQYMVYEYLRLAELLNIPFDNKGLELAVSEEEQSLWIKELEKEQLGGFRVGIAPGASFGSSKRWDVQRFATVAEVLTQKYGLTPILITGPGEEEIKNDFSKYYKKKFIDPFINGHHLSRLKAVIKNLDLLICNDSGPRHIAIAFDIPVICLMGPTKPEYTESPWERGEVLRVPVDCGPCQLPECPTDHRCMTLITPEMVLNAIEKWLNKR
ncbi:MAG: lipopolysaccharide heptosyltransferase II [Candidatus Hydrogenedens sp.]|nr:lipopolysaccharide heptosyltransferase II [Candidatus Hydrogenedens sp.]